MVKMSLKESENPSPEIHSLMSKLKVMESDRVKSFKNWQYGNQENCSVQKVCLSRLDFKTITLKHNLFAFRWQRLASITAD